MIIPIFWPLFWVFTVVVSASAVGVIALTLADVLKARKQSAPRIVGL
jgi:hypothetical protein